MWRKSFESSRRFPAQKKRISITRRRSRPRTLEFFFLYEQYADAAGYEAHKASAYFKENVFDYIINFLETREVQTYETIDI